MDYDIGSLDWAAFEKASCELRFYGRYLYLLRLVGSKSQCSSEDVEEAVEIMHHLGAARSVLTEIHRFDIPLTLSRGAPENAVRTKWMVYASAHHMVASVINTVVSTANAVSPELLGTDGELAALLGSVIEQLSSIDELADDERAGLELARKAVQSGDDVRSGNWLTLLGFARARVLQGLTSAATVEAWEHARTEIVEAIPDWDSEEIYDRMKYERTYCFQWMYDRVSPEKRRTMTWNSQDACDGGGGLVLLKTETIRKAFASDPSMKTWQKTAIYRRVGGNRDAVFKALDRLADSGEWIPK